jgi:hypothetical protein
MLIDFYNVIVPRDKKGKIKGYWWAWFGFKILKLDWKIEVLKYEITSRLPH